jgi:hypothetical protein
VDASSHPLCQASVEGTNLGVDVGKERKACPSTDFHDEGIVDTLEFEGHGT